MFTLVDVVGHVYFFGVFGLEVVVILVDMVGLLGVPRFRIFDFNICDD